MDLHWQNHTQYTESLHYDFPYLLLQNVELYRSRHICTFDCLLLPRHLLQTVNEQWEPIRLQGKKILLLSQIDLTLLCQSGNMAFIVMKSAVIKTGGKQYLVSEGEKLKIEKLEVEAGKKVTFDEVLLAITDKTTSIGTPALKGASVEGKVLSQGKHDKIYGVKFKAKKRYMRYFGHRQPFTEVEITKITTK
jgi:large subunit ribosomal protein L21